VPKGFDARLMVGYDSSDDACVYRISDTLALIQTVDFFPPIVDDPFSFGQIAAANALSDIYAMGAAPAVAMNLLCFPSCLKPEIASEILAGGSSKVIEAGAVIAGGHSIDDDEPKYGLCVSGFAHPDEILKNTGACEGDVLVLTKPLGTGILSTAAKAEILDDETAREMIELMSSLNKNARDAMMACAPNACTDITGFGLLGHALEMAKGSGKSFEIFSAQVPVLSAAERFAKEGIIPGGAYRNMEYASQDAEISGHISRALLDVFADPQTSGGLLISIPEKRLPVLLARMLDGGAPGARMIGRVCAKSERFLKVV
jgi:selenide,water dikinase